MSGAPQFDRRVLILAPSVSDAPVLAGLLERDGVSTKVCTDVADFVAGLREGAGAAVVAEEALDLAALEAVAAALVIQPEWSDLQLVLLTVEDHNPSSVVDRIWRSARSHVTVLERPVQVQVLLAAVRVALQARERQYQVRDELARRLAAERALRESEQRFRLMADRLPLIVWVQDEAGRQLFVNQTFCDYFGVRREDMSDDHWVGLMHPDDADAYLDRFLACVRARRPFHAEVRVRRADGQWRHLESWATPHFDRDGRFFGHVGTSADVTERKDAETALRDADRRKDEFLATLGHELRNPLSALQTGLEVIRLEPDADHVPNTYALMERQLANLTRLVDDLLDVSRITHGKLELRRTRVVLQTVVHDAIEATHIGGDATEHCFSVRMPEQPVVLDADPLRLAQVFVNLLSNAIKYTPAGGRIDLVVEPRDQGVEVTVRDDGLGIPRDRLPGLFGMFEQIDRSIETGSPGLGIGLAIAKSLVDMHGGRIEADSAGPETGSEFRVWLPTVDAPAAAAPPTVPPPAAPAADHGLAATLPSRRVLVVEDNHDAARTLARLLRLLGHEVLVAFDGIAALELVRQTSPDIVLLDIGLPKLNGYAVARQIRALPFGDRIVIAAMTGWGQARDQQRSLDAGMDRHLTKPLDPAQLQAVLQSTRPRGQVTGAGATAERAATEQVSTTRAVAHGSAVAGHPPDPRPAAEPAASEPNSDTASSRRPLRRLVHDLRGSLSALNLHLRILEVENPDQGELRRPVARALAGSAELGALIDELDERTRNLERG